MQVTATLLSPRAVRALALSALSTLLLTACVTPGGGNLQFVDTTDPKVQQRTDIFLQAFEEGCLAQRLDVMINSRPVAPAFPTHLVSGTWPGKPMPMPMRYGSSASKTQQKIAEWNYYASRWNGAVKPDSKFDWKLRGTLLKDVAGYYDCRVHMWDVDIDRIAAALAEKTATLGQAYGNWLYEKHKSNEQTRYLVSSLDLPVILRLQSISDAADDSQYYHYGEPIGFSQNKVSATLVIGVPHKNFPALTAGEVLRTINTQATQDMRQEVALYTASLQGALTADFDRRISARADRDAESARKTQEYLDELNSKRRSNSDIFADALNQSVNNMRRQQEAFDRIDRQVGGTTPSQQRLNAAREAGRNGIIPGGGSGSGSSSSGSGGSGSSSSGGGLTLCAQTYVDPPAKYRSMLASLSYGCGSKYQSAAEVNAVYSQQINDIEKSRAAMQAAKDRQDALRQANRVDTPPKPSPCAGVTGNCTISKP